MEPDSQEEMVKRLETKLGELREQRIKVDEANEILRKKLQTLTKHLDDLDLKYAKDEGDKEEEATRESKATDSNSTPVAPEPEKSLVPDDRREPTSEGHADEKNIEE